MSRWLLGIDLGTSGCKTIAIDVEGCIKSEASIQYPTRHPEITWAEQNPDDLLNAVYKTIEITAASARKSRAEIVGVSIDAPRETVIPVDNKGKWLAQGILWIDQRTKPQEKMINNLISPEMVLRTTGLPIRYIHSAAKIMWIRENRPTIFQKTKFFLQTHTYVLRKLTGEIFTSPCSASRTMLLDIHSCKWSPEICDALKIPISMLAPLRDAGEVAGETTSDTQELTGLAKGTPVAVGAGDDACDALGAGAVDQGQCNIGMATGLELEAPINKPKPDMTGRADCLCHCIPNTWIYEIPPGIAAGGSLEWFKRDFGYEEVEKSKEAGISAYKYFDDLAAKVPPGSEGLFFYPYLWGHKLPTVNPEARAVFYGIVQGHTKAHFIRSILEAICFHDPLAFKVLEDLGIELGEGISISGGGAKSRLWNQIRSDMLNKRIRTVSNPVNTTPKGSAILAGVAAKIYPNAIVGAKKTVKFEATLEPDAERHKTYSELYSKYHVIRELLEKTYAR